MLKKASPDLLFILLFLLLSGLQLFLIAASPLSLSGDEAHYWDWSRRLDYCYYSKGPLLAWLIAGSELLFGQSGFSVRFSAALCYALFSLFFYLFIRAKYSASAALTSWIALRSMLMFAQTGFVMTTDAPMALFWLLALWAGYEALFEKRLWAWPAFAAASGLAVWSKYTALFLPVSILLFCFCVPKYRLAFRLRSARLAAMVFGLFLVPIVFWNSQHDWVNFAHNSGHLVKGSGIRLRPGYLLELLGGQLALLGPLLFLAIVYALRIGSSPRKDVDERLRYFVVMSLPLAIFIIVISLNKRVYANWPLPVYIGGLAALSHLWSESEEFRERFQKLLRPAIGISLLLTVLAHLPPLGFTLGVPGKILPTKKLVGWQEMAEVFDRTLDAEAAQENLFVISDRYWTASALGFYSTRHPKVLLANISDRRMTQFDVWQDGSAWESERGKDAVIVLNDRQRVERLRQHFQTVEPAQPQPSLSIEYSGSPVREFHFYIGRGFDGFPTPAPEHR